MLIQPGHDRVRVRESCGAASGYDAEWESFSAAEFNAPHQRERLFILADRDGDSNLDTLRAGTRGQGSESFSWWSGGLDLLVTGNGIERADSYTDILRAVDGIPDWMDRTFALGNAVVPQVAEWIGRRIVEAASLPENCRTNV